jgi:hypothetical protein
MSATTPNQNANVRSRDGRWTLSVKAPRLSSEPPVSITATARSAARTARAMTVQRPVVQRLTFAFSELPRWTFDGRTRDGLERSAKTSPQRRARRWRGPDTARPPGPDAPTSAMRGHAGADAKIAVTSALKVRISPMERENRRRAGVWRSRSASARAAASRSRPSRRSPTRRATAERTTASSTATSTGK